MSPDEAYQRFWDALIRQVQALTEQLVQKTQQVKAGDKPQRTEECKKWPPMPLPIPKPPPPPPAGTVDDQRLRR